VFTAAGTSFTLGSVTINSGGTAPAASTVQGYNSAGTDIAGGALSINGGTGRGTGDGGAITFKVAPDLATGTTAGTLVTAGTINQTSVTFGAFSTVSGGTAPTASTYAGVHGVGTDIAGGAVSLDGGKGTGTGDGGAVTIKVAPDQATGTGVNPYVTAATINQTSVTLGNFTTVSGGTAPGASTYAGVNSAGTNIAGGSTTLQSGTGTGSGAVPNVVVKTPEILGTGTTTQTHIITSDHSQKSLAAADNADVALYTVTLATQDTGCGAHISWIYTVTDTADTSTHAGILICVFRNDDATVTGACADSGEVSIGTACGAGCDTNSVGVAGTTATVNMKFDNLLTQTGGLRYSVLNNTCPTFVRQ
jgi:predicted cupin superfamily sugar epimerase